MVATALKWKRISAGKYAAAYAGHTIFCERFYTSQWRLYLDGGYALTPGWRTASYAKGMAVQSLPALLSLRETRLEQERAKELAASADVREKENRLRAIRAPVYDPTSGVSWFDWAEHFVGCTAKQVQEANAVDYCEHCGNYDCVDSDD